MNGATIRRIAIWLSIALSFTTLLVILGRTSSTADPTITSGKPSGTRILSELLEQNGLSVRQDRNQMPQLKSDELALAFVKVEDGVPTWPGQSPQPFPTESTIRKRLGLQAEQGRRIVLIYLDQNFNRATVALPEPGLVQNQLNPKLKPRKVDTSRATGAVSSSLDYSSFRGDLLPVWMIDQKIPMVSFETRGAGMVIHIHDGIAATNRFIDRNENAAFFTDLITSLAGPSKKVVFTEASFGNIADDGILSALGGWARASMWQAILLFGVIAWTFAVPFGMPWIQRRRQSGTRDLMEAFSALMRRARNRPLAMGFLISSIERDMRRSVGLAQNAPESVLKQRIPPEAWARFEAVRYSSKTDAPLRELQSLRDEFRAARPGRKT